MFRGVGGCRIVSATVRRGAFISYSRRRQYNGVELDGEVGSFIFEQIKRSLSPVVISAKSTLH